MTTSIELVPARDLRIGDVFSTDGYTVTAAVLLEGGGAPAEVWVEARRDDDPRAKTAYVPADQPLPLWRGAAS